MAYPVAHRQPSFFRIIDRGGPTRRLCLPRDFAREDPEQSPWEVHLLCNVDDRWTCMVRSSTCPSGHFQLDEGWLEFAQAMDIKGLDVLVFYRVGRRVYAVSVYGTSRCIRQVQQHLPDIAGSRSSVVQSFYVPINSLFSGHAIMLPSEQVERILVLNQANGIVHLLNWSGEAFPVRVTTERDNHYFEDGWMDFRVSNAVTYRDLVTFHHIADDRFRVAVFANDGWFRVDGPEIPNVGLGNDVEAMNEPPAALSYAQVRKLKANFKGMRQDLSRLFVEENQLQRHAQLMLENVWGSRWEAQIIKARNHGTPRYYIAPEGWEEFTDANEFKAEDILLFYVQGQDVISVARLPNEAGEAIIRRAGRGGVLTLRD